MKAVFLGYIAIVAAATAVLLPEGLKAATQIEDRTVCAIAAYSAYQEGYDYSTEYEACTR